MRKIQLRATKNKIFLAKGRFKMNDELSQNDVETITETSVNDDKRPATIIKEGVVSKDEIKQRKDGRITNVFEFNEENVTRGRYEQFETLSDMVLHFIKSYKEKPLKDYIKVVQRPEKPGSEKMVAYETLRIPKATQEACYTKLKTFMVIEETKISARKTQYYVKEVYDRAEIANK